MSGDAFSSPNTFAEFATELASFGYFFSFRFARFFEHSCLIDSCGVIEFCVIVNSYLNTNGWTRNGWTRNGWTRMDGMDGPDPERVDGWTRHGWTRVDPEGVDPHVDTHTHTYEAREKCSKCVVCVLACVNM